LFDLLFIKSSSLLLFFVCSPCFIDTLLGKELVTSILFPIVFNKNGVPYTIPPRVVNEAMATSLALLLGIESDMPAPINAPEIK